MDFNEQLRLLEAAQGNSHLLTLASLDIMLSSQPPELKTALEIAAIPHWFDGDILAALLDDDLRPDSQALFARLITLPCVETFRSRNGFNVHESARLALRQRLYQEQPARFCELARRAVDVFKGEDTVQQIEQVYHLLIAEPEQAGFALRLLDRKLSGYKDQAFALTLAVEEYAENEIWPDLARGWGFYLKAVNRKAFRNNAHTIESASLALQCFQNHGDNWAAHLAMCQLGDAAIKRGDLTQAQHWFKQQFRIAEDLLSLEPDNPERQRDLSLSLSCLGDLAQQRGDAGQAQMLFQRGLDIRENLAARDPENSGWQRGNAGQAQILFQRGLDIVESLAARDPENSGWQRDVSMSLERLGNLAQQRGDAGQAQMLFQRGLDIRENLAARDPENSGWQYDLYLVYWRLAEVSELMGEAGEANNWWKKTYQQLDSMKQRGWFISAADKGNLAWLKRKLQLD
jgi:tetratricopeptide (TPR) repeat protein